MKRSFVQIDGVLYEKGSEPVEPAAPLVMPDIKPYTSMIDGSTITSRSKHREHLRAHRMIEIGNETKELFKRPSIETDPAGRKELIRAQVDAMRFDDFRRAIKRDIDRVKWNSRED